MENLKLRPHHALCIQFFIGKGYSQDFTDNMYSVINQLKSNPYITVTMSADSLCKSCPNLRAGTCINEIKVHSTDIQTALICGFKDKEIIKASEFFKCAHDRIIKAERLAEICKNCRWNNICFKANK